MTVAVLAAFALGLALAVVCTLFIVRAARDALRRPVHGGAEGLIGRVGVVRRPLDPVGRVMLDSELWSARRSWAEENQPPPTVGELVIVDRVQGLMLSVRRAEDWEVEP